MHKKLKGQRHWFRNDLAKYMQILMQTIETDADIAMGFQYTARYYHQVMVQNSSSFYGKTKWKAIKITIESKMFDIHMCPTESHWFIGDSVSAMIFIAAFSFQLKTKVICLLFLIPFCCNSENTAQDHNNMLNSANCIVNSHSIFIWASLLRCAHIVCSLRWHFCSISI